MGQVHSPASAAAATPCLSDQEATKSNNAGKLMKAAIEWVHGGPGCVTPHPLLPEPGLWQSDPALPTDLAALLRPVASLAAPSAAFRVPAR